MFVQLGAPFVPPARALESALDAVRYAVDRGARQVTLIPSRSDAPGPQAEHGVDMDTGAIVSVTVQDASDGDSATLPETLTKAAETPSPRNAAYGLPVGVKAALATELSQRAEKEGTCSYLADRASLVDSLIVDGNLRDRRSR